MTYRGAIAEGMAALAQHPAMVAIGYNLAYGSRGYGTMTGVDRSQIYEMPLSEALIAGMGIGMALAGYRPVLFFERQDFLTLAADAMINHLGLIQQMSDGQYRPGLIIRAVIGGRKPFDAGPQHNKRLVRMIADYLPCRLYEPVTVSEVEIAYLAALRRDPSETIIISEARDFYDSTR